MKEFILWTNEKADKTKSQTKLSVRSRPHDSEGNTLPHHVLVAVGQVNDGGGVFHAGQPVPDRVLLNGGVIDRPRPLPRHQQAAEVERRRLDVLGLRAAD